MMKQHSFFIPVLALALSGCGIFFASPRERAVMKTPEYQSGYSDGCASASANGVNPRQSMIRDQSAYESSAAYRAGWANGHTVCRPQSPDNKAAPNAGPIPDNSPGNHL